MRWRRESAGMNRKDARRVKELEKEGTRLKRLPAKAEGSVSRHLEGGIGGKPRTAVRKRAAVSHVVSVLRVKASRACNAQAVVRSTHGFRPRRPDHDRVSAQRLHRLSKAHPCNGHSRIAALPRNDGWPGKPKGDAAPMTMGALKAPPRPRKRL